MTATYGGKATIDEAVKSGEEVVVGNTTTDFTAEDSKEHQEYTKEAEEAENAGKEVQQGNDGESFIIEQPATEEEKGEASNADGSQLSDDKLADMLPPKQENDNKVETEKPATDNKVETEEPAADNKVETEEPATDNKVETEEPATDNKVETEEPATDDKVEIEQPVKVEKLSVEALDGNTAIVGSSIQFKVTGENVTFEGLEGYNYAYNNNILTVQTGSEATVLTIAATDATGASILFDININGIVG